MTASAETAAVAPPTALRAVALACGASGVLLALGAPTLAALIEHLPVRGFILFDEEIAATRSFAILSWLHALLGAGAIVCALSAYLRGGFARAGRVGLVLGVAALAWKIVLYALLICVVLFLLSSGIGS